MESFKVGSPFVDTKCRIFFVDRNSRWSRRSQIPRSFGVIDCIFGESFFHFNSVATDFVDLLNLSRYYPQH